MDCAGNVYTSSGSIMSPAGTQVGTFAGGTNLAFGGVDGKTPLRRRPEHDGALHPNERARLP